jgi:hypothetical protein
LTIESREAVDLRLGLHVDEADVGVVAIGGTRRGTRGCST